METKSKAKLHKGFLSRLRADQSGNVIAILAAAIIPAIGIVGGAVDMSRIFIVRTSLQAACDAGSLMGRRVMGSGAWADNDGKANTKAVEMFLTNFEDGSYGTTNLVKTFTETNGKVTGVATVDVPMALMSVFGINEKSISVTCDAEMRLPASDIMFVLDTTGSMNCPDVGTGCGNNGGVEAPNAKMKGLRKASSCFYEALTKQNITGYTPEDCGETADPQGATSDVRLRFGFVPYSVNANVGRLLPLNYMADQWTYQSRQPVFTTTTTYDYDYTLGNESSYAFNSQGSFVDAPTRNINNWTNLTQNLAHTNGQNYSYRFLSSKNGSCGSNIPNSTLTFNGTNYTFVSQSPATITYPTSSVTKTYTTTDVTAQYLYQYFKQKVGNKYYCQLQYKTTSTKARTTTYTTTTAVTWTGETITNTAFDKWIYKPVTMNVGALKNTASNSWNSSLTTNLGDNGSSKTINWNGCIEERQTARINDDDPSDNWTPTIPSDALDMDIETAPTSDAATKWGPLLGGVVYNKYKYNNGGWWDYTTDQYETSENRTYYPDYTYVTYDGSYYTATDTYEYCPSAAKLYSQMDATAFSNYLNGLATGGNTYHDIGLLWGARLMAPEGIFKSVTADTNNWTERHMIFMTDGDTSVGSSDYSAHGVHWWDRRQNDGTSGPSSEWLEANVDARTQALCRWIRNENITLWVVAFGEGISDATKTNLQNCATTGRYFEAADTADLIDNFKQIATTISALRLTN